LIDSSKNTKAGPGAGTLVAMLVALVAGLLPLVFLADSVGSWQIGAAVGFGLSGLLGLIGWWATRRAAGQNQAVFIKTVFGFMLLRLTVAGLAAGLVIGLKWLHAHGFVAGLFSGVILFQVIEINGVLAAARRSSSGGPGNLEPIEGATENAS
jgi:hypothetical protein